MGDDRPDPDDTTTLLGRARAGDRDAFEVLFARHRDYLHRLVELRLDPRLSARVDPSDVVQDAHLEAVRRLDDYLARQPIPFRLWLRQIVYDRVLKARRLHGAARRATDHEVPLPEPSALLFADRLRAADSSPSRRLDRGELARRLREAMGRLSDADREVVLLRDFEGLSNPEVGCLLGIDAAAVSKRHGRALLRLHRILFEDGLTESQV
jgi:RNA polymerase sigma-70 factor (ECF subfamily)